MAALRHRRFGDGEIIGMIGGFVPSDASWSMASRHREVSVVGDKSPKSKQRDQKQKDAVKAQTKAKKDAATTASQVPAKKK